ncbi:MAG: hypothetical protein AABY86_03865 [Bdellovibrionota bacterium]
MRFSLGRYAAVLFCALNLMPTYAQDAVGAASENYDPNQVRNDDLRNQGKSETNSKISKEERDKKLDEMVDKFEELRLREEALAVKKTNLTQSNDKDGLEDLEDEFKDLARDRAKIDKEMAALRN